MPKIIMEYPFWAYMCVNDKILEIRHTVHHCFLDITKTFSKMSRSMVWQM